MKSENHKYLKVAIVGYATYLVIGGILLCMPFAQASGEWGSIYDGLFMASSAISTTGLGTVPVSSYTWIGQFILLSLVQIGGLGYMTIGAFVFTSIKRSNPTQREFVQRSMSNSLKENPVKFLQKIVIYTFLVEALGALFLLPAMIGVTSSLPEAIWSSIFHSVSAFCTAGFSLFDQNLIIFANNNYAMFVFIIIMMLGGLGFLVAFDTWDIIRKKRDRYTFTSKLIMWSMSIVAIGGTTLVFFTEGANYSLMQTLFTVVSAMTTAGFNVYSLTIMYPVTAIVFYLLMTIGCAPVSTGGGMKITNVIMSLFGVRAYIRGDEYASVRNNRISKYETRKAIAGVMTYVGVLIASAILFFIFQPTIGLEEGLFELTSALGTTGLSMGITASLNNANKLLLTLVMFIGRIGPIVLFDYLIYYFRQKSYIEDSVL